MAKHPLSIHEVNPQSELGRLWDALQEANVARAVARAEQEHLDARIAELTARGKDARLGTCTPADFAALQAELELTRRALPEARAQLTQAEDKAEKAAGYYEGQRNEYLGTVKLLGRVKTTARPDELDKWRGDILRWTGVPAD